MVVSWLKGVRACPFGWIAMDNGKEIQFYIELRSWIQLLSVHWGYSCSSELPGSPCNLHAPSQSAFTQTKNEPQDTGDRMNVCVLAIFHVQPNGRYGYVSSGFVSCASKLGITVAQVVVGPFRAWVAFTVSVWCARCDDFFGGQWKLQLYCSFTIDI